MLIHLIKSIQPLIKQKIVLFSEFMAMNEEPLLLTKKGNERYLVMPSDHGISRKLYIGHQKEHLKAVSAIQLIEKNREKIKSIYDIGANIGQIIIPLIKANHVENAIAIEPESNNMKLCKANCIINGIEEKVVFFQNALGAKENEMLRIELSDNNSGDHRVRVTEENGLYSEISRKCMLVKSTTLDSYYPQNGDTKHILLWIDVQGWEGKVLEGGHKFIQNRTPVGFEFWPYALKRSGCFDLLVNNISCYNNLYEVTECLSRRISISEICNLYEKCEAHRSLDVGAF